MMIGKVNKVFYFLCRNINFAISVETKKTIFNMYIRQIIYYGANVINPSKTDRIKINTL